MDAFGSGLMGKCFDAGGTDGGVLGGELVGELIFRSKVYSASVEPLGMASFPLRLLHYYLNEF